MYFLTLTEQIRVADAFVATVTGTTVAFTAVALIERGAFTTRHPPVINDALAGIAIQTTNGRLASDIGAHHCRRHRHGATAGAAGRRAEQTQSAWITFGAARIATLTRLFVFLYDDNVRSSIQTRHQSRKIACNIII